MKRVLSILLALCLLVGVLPMAASARGINRYTETIQQLIKERVGNKNYINHGLFYDLDGDGIEEMLVIRQRGNAMPSGYASLYTIVDGEAVCLMKDQYVYTSAGGNQGYLVAMEKAGKTYLGIFDGGSSYGGPGDTSSSGEWKLYQINRTTGKLVKTNTASFRKSDRHGVITNTSTIDGKKGTYAQFESWVKSFTIKDAVNRGENSKYNFEALLRLSKADTTGDLPTTTVGGFKDVFVDSYYAEAVKGAVDNDITSGVSANKFGPAEPCQRQQIVTFLWKNLGRPEPQGIADFTDMPATEVFRKAISWAAETGITSGAGNNRFGSSSGCTRAEAMTFIWRALDRPDPKSTASFTDLPNSPDMQKAISWAAENGITAGAGNNRFGSNQICKREEIVTFLYKANNLQK